MKRFSELTTEEKINRLSKTTKWLALYVVLQVTLNVLNNLGILPRL